jgi:hypothetical protein
MKQKIRIYSATFLSILSFGLPAFAYAAGPTRLDLMSAGNFTIITKTGITNTGSHTSTLTGNIGSSPITSAAMDNVFCSEITGTIYGVDAAYTGSGATTCFAGNPPLSNKTTIDNAVLDMGTAYTDAEGRTLPDGTELYAGNLGSQTFAPGLYKWSTNVIIPTSMTLSGGSNDVWIFQIAGNLDVSSGASIPTGTQIILAGGAQASNVFWQVGGVSGTTLGTYSTFNGTILASKQIVIQTGAVLTGQAFSQTQVTLDANRISMAGYVAPVVAQSSTSGGQGSSSTSGGHNRNWINPVADPVTDPVVATVVATVVSEPVSAQPLSTLVIVGGPTLEQILSLASNVAPSFPNTGIAPHAIESHWYDSALRMLAEYVK